MRCQVLGYSRAVAWISSIFWAMSVVSSVVEGQIRLGVVTFLYSTVAGLTGMWAGYCPTVENTSMHVSFLRFGCIGCTLTFLYVPRAMFLQPAQASRQHPLCVGPVRVAALRCGAFPV